MERNYKNGFILSVFIIQLLSGPNFSQQIQPQSKDLASFRSDKLIADSEYSAPKSLWTIRDPFKAEYFIENKGQFDYGSADKTAVPLYGVSNGEMKVYFINWGLTYHLANFELKDNTEKGRHELREETERAFHKHGAGFDQSILNKFYIDRSSFINIQWLGCNKNCKIEVVKPVNEYFTYSLIDGKESIPVRANAFKKLIYKNLYPNIDVEYYFPGEDKGGIKYNVVVYPGGDVSQVKMKYSGDKGLIVDEMGNLLIKTNTDPYVDHAPVSYLELSQNSPIKTSFVLNGQVVSFHVGNYDKTKKLTIDPWVNTTAGFTANNNGYGIRVDYFGNCYVYGGGTTTGFGGPAFAYQVKKFNSAGVVQWTFTTPTATSGYYGDIAVDRAGNSFVGAGFGFTGGNNIIKLNPAGTQIAAMPAYTPPGAGFSFEQWKLSYNQATNSGFIYIGGGGSQGFQNGKINTNLTGNPTVYNSHNSTKTLKDIVYIAQEKDESFIYSNLSCNSASNGVCADPEDRTMVKLNTANLAPYIWRVNNPSPFMEVGQCSFLNSNGGFGTFKTTGLNGMVVCDTYIYTHDGAVLSAWTKGAGATAFTVNTGGTYNAYSGIDVDSCCRVYVGLKGIIKRYSDNLTFDKSIPTSGDVYDLKINPLNDKQIYVTGKGFVELIELPFCPTCINATKTDVSGCTLGTGTATVTDPDATMPLSYQWSNGGNTQSISGLQPGTYIITVKDAAPGCPLIWKDTIVVAGTFVPCGPVVTLSSKNVCPGGCAVLTAPASAGAPPYTYSWSPGAGGNTSGYNVCPTATTIYTVTVTDSKGVSATTTGSVTIYPDIVLTTTKNDVSCNGGNNGSASVSVSSGGTAPFTFSWTPSGGNGATTTPDLGTGTYTVSATDSNGCTKTASEVISEPPVVSIVTNTTAANCSAANGSATATVTGGIAPYTYQWSPATGTTATISNIAGGTYIVTVTDSKGCTKTSSAFVNNTGGPAVTITGTDPSCNGGSDGSISSAVSGGTSPYTYSWSPSGGSATIASNLPSGNYTVYVTDATGCQVSGTTTLSQPAAITLSSSKTDANCGGADGSATVTAAGGAGGYTYIWSNTQTTSVISNVVAAIYSVTVTDSKGCSVTTTVDVKDVGSPSLTSSSVDVLCNGASTGSVTVTVSGGVPSYTFSWSNSATTQNITSVPAGTYSLTVTGSNGCKVSTTVTITEPSYMVLATSKVDANCGASDGSATVNVTGGVAPYSYSWNSTPVSVSATANAIPSGTYLVKVTDGNSCTLTGTVSVNDIGAPTLTTTFTNAKCNGGQDGTATATATGGMAPYTYAWNSVPVQTTPTATGLAAGTYGVTITAANGCKINASVAISQPALILLTDSSTDESCGSKNGTVTVNATGGTAPYSYVWSTSPVQNTTVATGLPAGTYTVVVSDGNGCVKTSTAGVVNIPGPTAVFSLTNACINTSTAFVDNSVNAVSWNWDFGDLSTSNLSNPTHIYSTDGTFPVKLTVTDAKGCVDSTTKTFTVYALPEVSFGDSTMGCSPLRVLFSNNSIPTAGSTYLWKLGDNTTSTQYIPSHVYTNTGTSPVSYNVSLKVTSAQGCVDSLTKVGLIKVFPVSHASFTMNQNVAEILAPTISFYNNSVGDSIRKWTFGDGDSSDVSNPVHTYKDTGRYEVCLTTINGYGCPDIVCSTVIIKPTWSFYIPSAFSPNGDMKNDVFRGYGENISSYEMYIFDRWGNEIFKSKNIEEAWNGKANGGSEIVQQDVYVYVVYLRDIFEKRHKYVGNITVVK